MREITIFSGGAHRALAEEMCDSLDTPLSPSTIRRFSNDCLYVQLNANCRERDVFILQPLVPPVKEESWSSHRGPAHMVKDRAARSPDHRRLADRR